MLKENSIDDTNGNKTFVRITNNDVYAEVREIRALLEKYREEDGEKHKMLITQQAAQDKKIAKGVILSTTALSLSIIVIGVVFKAI